MASTFTRISSLVLATALSVGLAAAQTFSPYTSTAAARGAKSQAISVDQSVVLPKTKSSFRLNVPTPGGGTTVLELRETPVMPLNMQLRYPEITTYRGRDVATGMVSAVTQTPLGINVYVAGAEGSWQVTADGPGLALISRVDDAADAGTSAPLSCGYTPEIHARLDAAQAKAAAKTGATQTNQKTSALVTKRKFIMALACTGEFATTRGGTRASVNAVFAEALNLLNAITIREVGVEFELHPQNDSLIFLNPGTDPYLQPSLGRGLLDENPPAINNRIPIEEYDIGHVFTNGCSDVGGVVGGRTCDARGKARGVTCHSSTNLNRIVERVLAHEVAHQFAVSHSWNNCPSSDNQRAGGAAFEPGSGSTIMSYQGSCGPDNNVSNIAPQAVYYHVGSIQQFKNYLESPNGATCAKVSTVENNLPEVVAPNIDGRTIPRETPFVLRGSATDSDGDALLYNWEQYDLGSAVDLCDQKEDTPLFRSVPPTSGGNERYFPNYEAVLTGRGSCEEQLPEFGRDLTFRLTARDRKAVAGGTAWREVKMKVDGAAGPFRVTSQATAAVQYVTGEFINVSWDVAGTSNPATVNTQQVEILLSTDGGRTFPTVLAAATPNDGTQDVTLPMTEVASARIMVRPIGNVYYAISGSTFSIITPTAPGFSFAPSVSQAFICEADTTTVDLFTSSLLNFDKEITVSLEGTLPAGVKATLTKTTLKPGENAKLRLDFTAFQETAIVNVDLKATADGAETVTRRLVFDLVSTNFDDLALRGPANGQSGLSDFPTFAFTPSRRASQYTVQVNTNPNFGFGTFEILNPKPEGDQLGFSLEPNQVYFWRVIPKNRCGEFYDVPVNAFHTFAAECKTFTNDKSFPIAPNSTASVTIPVPVAESGPVNDVSVPLVDIGYLGGIENLTVSLVSPDGTEVTLYNKRCAGGSLKSGYDDEAPLPNNCSPQPTDGQLRRPNRPLSAFNGKEINGEWKLRLDIAKASPTGGEFKSFKLEFCANITSQAPTFQSKLVPVPQGGFQYLVGEYLSAADPDNNAADLEYIIVEEPKRGHLELYGVRLEKGDKFLQAQSQTGGVTYVDDANAPGNDSMRIVLSDNAGNLIATPRVDFNIDPSNVTGVEERATVGMTLAPNPAGSWSRLRFNTPSEGGQLTILDAQGRRVHSERVSVGQSEVDIDAGAYPAGIYLVDYRGAEGVRTMRLVRQ